MNNDTQSSFVFGEDTLTLAALEGLSNQSIGSVLSEDKSVLARIEKSEEHVQNLLKRDGKIYGVTTGYGDSVVRAVSQDLIDELPLHLSRFR